jgi:ubiquinone/menaquinone biosynthesis C-methylase UbiE
MKLNWAERWVVNNPIRAFWQGMEIRWLRKKMSLDSGSTVLEVGCGRGAGARLILREFQPSLLHALDLDIEMIQMVKSYLLAGERERVRLYVGDVFQLPFRDASLDAVFGFGVLHHIHDWRGALAEITRVLKLQGVYFLEEIYPPLYQNVITKRIMAHPGENRFLSDDLREAMKGLKLQINDAIEVEKLGILGVAVKKA